MGFSDLSFTALWFVPLVAGFTWITLTKPLAGFVCLQALFTVLGFLVDILLYDRPEVTVVKELATSWFVALLLARIAVSRTHRDGIAHHHLLVPLLLCFAAAFQALLRSPYLERALAESRFFMLYPVLMVVPPLIRWSHEGNPEAVRRFMRLMLIVGVVVAVYGLLSYFLGEAVDPRWTTSPDRMQAVTQRSSITGNAVISTVGNRTNMGALAAFMIILGVGARDILVRNKLLFLASLSACGLALLLSFSRTAYIGAAVGLAAVGLLALFGGQKQRNAKGWIVAAFVGLAMFALANYITAGEVTGALNQLEPTMSGRTDLWAEDVIPGILASPFGVGLGVYGQSLVIATNTAQEFSGLGAVDNSFLLILAEQGVPGLVAWGLLLALIGGQLIRNCRVLLTPVGRRLNSVALSWYVSFLAMAISIDWFHALPVIAPLWFVLGLAYALPTIEATWFRGNLVGDLER